MPRAYVVYAAENIDSEAETVQRLLDEDFPIRQVAVTETSDLLPVSTEIPATPASITEYTDTKVIVQANSAAEGLLILGDQFHPGWQVTVNGQPAPLLRVNHIFRGVRLPPGEHEIVFKFNPQSLQIGMLLSGIGIALVLVVAILGIRRAKITELSKSAAASHP
jgi:hypothetical protein